MMLSSVLAAGLILTPVSILGAPSTAAAATTHAKVTAVFVDGAKLSLNPSPLQLKGTTFVPMREIFKALNSSVTWEPATKTILAVKGRTTISLQIGSKRAVKNGSTIALPEAPQQINGATMVPLRFVAEALGADVQSDLAKGIIRITSAEAIAKHLQEEEEKEELANQPKLSTKQIVDMNDGKVVMVTTDVGQGSGVVIGEDEILTNYHVIVDTAKGSITLLNGKQVELQGIVGYNENYDLAVVKTKTPLNIKPVTIGVGASKGDHVVAIGSPLGFQNTISDGVISNFMYDGADYYQISVPIDHGSSGGGLFNDYGQLIGITAAGIESTQADLNFAVSSMNIMMLLYDIEDSPPAKIEFLPKQLPDSLAGASTDTIRELMEKEFAQIQSSQGTTELKKFEVTRDAEGWLVINAVIDPAFYMLYGGSASDDMRYWAIDTGYKLHKMLPDEKIQLTVYYDQVFTFKPRDFADNEVTAVGDGTWRVRFPVIEFQGKEKVFVKVRA